MRGVSPARYVGAFTGVKALAADLHLSMRKLVPEVPGHDGLPDGSPDCPSASRQSPAASTPDRQATALKERAVGVTLRQVMTISITDSSSGESHPPGGGAWSAPAPGGT